MSQIVAYCILEPARMKIVAESPNLRKTLSVDTPAGILHLVENAFEDFALAEILQAKNVAKSCSTTVLKDGTELLIEANRMQVHSEAAPPAEWVLVSFQLVTGVLTEDSVRVDPVTGLPDRRALDRRIKVVKDLNSGQPHPFALLFLDLNGFKQVNDQWGHLLGDRFLAEAARRWKDSLRQDDLLVRYGGDEFVVLLPRIAQREEAETIVKRLEETLSVPFNIEGHCISLGVSIGVALSRPDHSELTDLLNEADRQMYERKSRLS